MMLLLSIIRAKGEFTGHNTSKGRTFQFPTLSVRNGRIAVKKSIQNSKYLLNREIQQREHLQFLTVNGIDAFLLSSQLVKSPGFFQQLSLIVQQID